MNNTDEQTPQQPTQDQPDRPTSSQDAAPQEETHTEPTAQPVTAAPRSRKKAVVVIAIVLALAVLGAVAYILATNMTSVKKQNDDPLKAATAFASPQALIDTVKSRLDGTVMDAVEVNGVRAIDKDGYFVYGAPAGTVAGKPYSVLPVSSNGTGVTGNSVAATANYKQLTDFFSANKFVQKQTYSNLSGPLSDTGNDVVYVAYAEYESAALRCSTLHADASGTPLKSHVVSVACADKSKYQEAVGVLQPLYDAYVKDGARHENVLMGIAESGEGAEGYEYAMTYQEEAVTNGADGASSQAGELNGYYYKAPSGTSWTLFKTLPSKDTPLCTSFDTPTLKKAFKGMECLDDKTKKLSSVTV